MREHVVAAANAMKKGDWKKCSEYILAIKVSQSNEPHSLLNYLLQAWNLFINVDEVKMMLTK